MVRHLADSKAQDTQRGTLTEAQGTEKRKTPKLTDLQYTQLEKECKRTNKISPEDFVLKAINSLRKDGYKGIHSVYSGFNAGFKKYFDGEDPVAVTNHLAQDRKSIILRPVKGGVMIYHKSDEIPSDRTDETLTKMGLVK